MQGVDQPDCLPTWQWSGSPESYGDNQVVQGLAARHMVPVVRYTKTPSRASAFRTVFQRQEEYDTSGLAHIQCLHPSHGTSEGTHVRYDGTPTRLLTPSHRQPPTSPPKD